MKLVVRRIQVPRFVRVSLGSAMMLGLVEGIIDAMPSTVYLLTYHRGRCIANCGFCPQARQSRGRMDLLSRVTWPRFLTESVVSKVGQIAPRGFLKRLCIQAVNYRGVFKDIVCLVNALKTETNIPISVCCQPVNVEHINELVKTGIDRMGIPIDAATEKIFDKVKGREVDGPYSWKRQIEVLEEALKILGKGRVSTHLIVGLGENDEEMVHIVQLLTDMGVYPSLFAFTPIPGTNLERRGRPQVDRYRRIQLAHHLVTRGLMRYEDIRFSMSGAITDLGLPEEELRHLVLSGKPFLTSGCPSCNRPFYNESPSGPIYNYPRKLSVEEVSDARKQVGI